MNALTDQMQRAAGNARYWLSRANAGERFYNGLGDDRRDNTGAFVAHYRDMLAKATGWLAANA